MLGVKVPNVVVVTLLTAVSLFLAANWPDQPWYQLANGALWGIIKAIEVNQPQVVRERLHLPAHESKLRRWLVG